MARDSAVTPAAPAPPQATSAPRDSAGGRSRVAASAAGRDSTAQKRRATPRARRRPHGHPDEFPKGPARHDTLSTAELKSLNLPVVPQAPKGHVPRVTGVVLDIRHQVFAAFHEREIVAMREEFRIGDTDYTARIIGFEPDWVMGLPNRKVYSRSNEPNNPAFHIVIKQKGAVRDTVWAFLNMPPHFAPRSLLSFRVVGMTFADHAPVPALPPDSSAARGLRKADSTAVRAGKR